MTLYIFPPAIYHTQGDLRDHINAEAARHEIMQKRNALKSEQQSDGPAVHSLLSGGGIVTAMALHCVCNAMIQLDTSSPSSAGKTESIGNFNFHQYVLAPQSQSKSGGKKHAHVFIQSTPIVRASALDCICRLAFAKHIARATVHSAAPPGSPKKGDAPETVSTPSLEPRRSYVAECISIVLHVINKDRSRYVRRSAALALLYAVQVLFLIIL